MVEIFEAAMLVAFGLSWPFNIIRALKVKTAKGQSLPFLCLIEFGYTCGILAKIISGKIIWWVFVIYCLDFAFVAVALVLYFINLNRDKKRAESSF